VSEYWTVDPEIDVVPVYRRAGEGFGRAYKLSRDAGDVLTTTFLPDLELPIDRVFRE